MFKEGDKVVQTGPHYLSDLSYQEDGPGEFNESPFGIGSTGTVFAVKSNRVRVRWDNPADVNISTIAKRALSLQGWTPPSEILYTLADAAAEATAAHTAAITAATDTDYIEWGPNPHGTAPAVTATVGVNKFFGDPLDVTKAERDGIMKFVTAIRPGLYLKCLRCEQFKPVDDARRVVYPDGHDEWFCVECA